MSRVLVTGGAGFVGSTFVRHLLRSTDDQVTVFDAFTYAGVPANLEALRDEPRVTVVRGDVADAEAVRAAMSDHDAVVHLAAESHVDRSHLDPDGFRRTNEVGTEVVCREAGRAGVARVVHASTDEVYGSRVQGRSAATDPLRPSSPYATSKAAADRVALAHHHDHDLPVVVVRSSNQFGPRQFPEKLIPRFVTLLLLGEQVPLYGDGAHRRDWLFVEDNCEALHRALHEGEPGTIHHVAGRNERTNLEVTRAILGLLDLDEDRIDHVADRPHHDRRYALDLDGDAGRLCPPARPFEPALEATVRWYVDHRRWWEPLLDLEAR